MPFPWIAVALAGSTIIDALLSNKKYPPEIEQLLKSLGVKGNELMMSEGYSQGEIDALFGKGYENVRAAGKNARESTTGTLARAGMLGTGTETAAAQRNAFDNQNLVTNAIRDMVIAKGAKKSQDQALATQMAQTAVGAESARVEKGPQLTELVALLGMMGVGTGQPKNGGAVPGPGTYSLNENLYAQRKNVLSNDLFGGGFDWLNNLGFGIQNTSPYWTGLTSKGRG